MFDWFVEDEVHFYFANLERASESSIYLSCSIFSPFIFLLAEKAFPFFFFFPFFERRFPRKLLFVLSFSFLRFVFFELGWVGFSNKSGNVLFLYFFLRKEETV